MNEEASKREELLAGAKEATRTQRRRLAEVQAREHVGAAGWAQTSTLESVIRAGREGLVATDALRQVIRLTTEQLRSLSLPVLSEQREEHTQALNAIVENGQQQLTAAQMLDEMVCQALAEVTTIPIDHLNVTRLKQIHQRVQQQVAALNTIIEAAQAHAGTLEQVAELEKVSADHQQRISEIRQFSAEEEVLALGNVGEGIVSRIVELDEAHPEQVHSLVRIAETVIEKMPDTGAPAEHQAKALQKLAQQAQEKAEELREG